MTESGDSSASTLDKLDHDLDPLVQQVAEATKHTGRMWTASLLIRILFVFATIVGLLFLNQKSDSAVSPVQLDFDTWVAALERTGNQVEVAPNGLVAMIAVELPEGAANYSSVDARTFSVSDPVDGPHRDEIIRLLQLAREGRVFSGETAHVATGPETTEAQSKGLRFTIGDNSKQWISMVPLSEFEGNVQILTLVKLLQVYANEGWSHD